MKPVLPLAGIRILELAGIGPGPFCGMMLADHGAEVIRIDRPGGVRAGVEVDGQKDVMLRSRRSITLDLKSGAGIEVVKKLAATADGLFEGFRPGVTERMGLGPDALLAINPKLVYGRMTGWGQTGPYASMPGHDINYIALNGALDAIGRPDGGPVPPLNLLGDYAGGGLMLAFGMIAAILAVKNGGSGQVVDCSMSEGASLLMAGIWTLKANRRWEGGRGENLLDGGAPFYGCYQTRDGRQLAIGAVEEKFFRRLCDLVGFGGDADFEQQYDRGRWPVMRQKLAKRFAEQPLDYWSLLFDDEDVCFAPVMSMTEAPDHPHNQARQSFIEVDGLTQPRPAPRFEKAGFRRPRMWREDSDAVVLLEELGYSRSEQDRLRLAGAFGPLETVD